MKYLLIVLLLSLLVAADHLLQQHREIRRRSGGTLRPFADLPVERVQSFQVRPGPSSRTWTYVQRDSTWRYPDYFEAFVQSARVDQLLGSLLQSLGTVVAAEPENRAHFGLLPEQAVAIDLQDASGALLLKVLVGRGAPGLDAGEAYVRKADSDTLFHLHANPRLVLGGGDPPMLDPHVLPRALKRRSIVRINFEHGSTLQALRRVETFPAGPPLPGRPYAWLAALSGREDTCLNASAFAYTSFLTRLRYEELHDPRHSEAFEEISGRLELVYEDGAVDVLEVGGRNRQGHAFLRHRTTGQVLTITAPKAELLFPTRFVLLDTLPQPSPYKQAEPFGPSRF